MKALADREFECSPLFLGESDFLLLSFYFNGYLVSQARVVVKVKDEFFHRKPGFEDHFRCLRTSCPEPVWFQFGIKIVIQEIDPSMLGFCPDFLSGGFGIGVGGDVVDEG